MFELLGEDQDDPDSNDEIVYEYLIIAMHRDDHLVDRDSVAAFKFCVIYFTME